MPAKPRCVNLRDHEVRQLLKTGNVLWVRPLRPQPDPDGYDYVTDYGIDKHPWTPARVSEAFPCPLGQVGDVLCGREAWFEAGWLEDPEDTPHRMTDDERIVVYAASCPDFSLCDDDVFRVFNSDGTQRSPWRSPATMPRWASRLSPRIAKVECRRLGNITPEECKHAGATVIGRDEVNSLSHGHYLQAFINLWKRHQSAFDPKSWAWFVTLTSKGGA